MSDQQSNGNGRLVYWILGALVALVGVLSGIAHGAIMRSMESIEGRIERIETLLLKR